MIADGPAALAKFLRGAQRGVVFTGAGISTESGIPDFRSPGGLWSQNAPVHFQDFVKSPDARRDAWRRRFAMDEVFSNARPNDGHRAVAELVARGMVTKIITQNIDNLHQDAGVPAEKVVEIHGNTHSVRCLQCGRPEDMDFVRTYSKAKGSPPRCAECGGILKTCTVSFGEKLPDAAIEQAQDATLACDIFLVLGSSLVVYPAAAFPEMARRHRAKLAIINRDPTPMDRFADLVLREEIGPVMRDALALL